MKKQNNKEKLALNKVTLRNLDDLTLDGAAGGIYNNSAICTNGCKTIACPTYGCPTAAPANTCAYTSCY